MGDAAEVIKGTIQNISRPFGSGWRFASVHPHGTVVGELGNLQPGDLCIFQGKWKSHPKYGRQFEARQAQIEIPKDKQGIREYLGRHFKWIGPTIARGLTEIQVLCPQKRGSVGTENLNKELRPVLNYQDQAEFQNYLQLNLFTQ